MEFNKTLVGIDEERDKEYVAKLKQENQNYIKDERKKVEDKLTKMRLYGKELKKQLSINPFVTIGEITKTIFFFLLIRMMESDSQLKRLELRELNEDKKDLNNMIKELQLIEKCEAEQVRIFFHNSLNKNQIQKLLLS